MKDKAQRTKRLIRWLQFFARENEGVGDVACRMLHQAQGRTIAPLLARLLSSCNCRTEDAADYLNKQYPYAERTQP